MSLTPLEKYKFKNIIQLLYLTYHFMETSIMTQLQMLLSLNVGIEIITVRILWARQCICCRCNLINSAFDSSYTDLFRLV